jgi:hypothetical protein
MSQQMRILIGVAVIVLIGGLVLGLEYLRGSTGLLSTGQVTLAPGSVPIYLDGDLVAAFAPDALESLEQVSFVDAEDGVLQDGWLVRDVLLTYLPEDSLTLRTQITISSSVREKSAGMTWAEVKDSENMVMFDLSNRGTLKLVSLLAALDTRDEWVQDVDRIEVVTR